MLQEPLGQGEERYQSLLAQIEKRSKDSKLLPAEPVKQQQLHAHPDPPPLTNNAQLSVTQQGAGVAADKVVRSDSQSRLQLDAAGSTLSAGEIARTLYPPQLAGANSTLQLLQQGTSSSSSGETSRQAYMDRKLNSNKRAPDAQHNQQQQQEGIPGSSKRNISVLPVAALLCTPDWCCCILQCAMSPVTAANCSHCA